MKATKNGFLHREKVIFSEFIIGNDINFPSDVRVFYGTKEQAIEQGYKFIETTPNHSFIL